MLKVRILSGTLVERRTRDTDIAGSNPPYFFMISSTVWFMLLLHSLEEKMGLSINWSLVKTLERGLEPLLVREDLKMAGILMYWIITDIGKLFYH